MSDESSKPKNKPTHEVKAGSVRATIWPNETDTGTRFNVTLSRLYRSGESWKSSSSFGARDLGDVTRASVLAEAWIREHEPKPSVEAEQ